MASKPAPTIRGRKRTPNSKVRFVRLPNDLDKWVKAEGVKAGQTEFTAALRYVLTKAKQAAEALDA